MGPRQDHLHWELDAGPSDTLQVTVDDTAHVFLMDDGNYQKYCQGAEHLSYGGRVDGGAQLLKPNRRGRWHVVVDMGRSGGRISAHVLNKATGQPVGAPQGRLLSGAASK